jgi:hypothetical protein
MEQWEDTILKSMEGAERAKAPKNAYSNILKEINQQNKPGKNRQWIAIAAAITLIALTNVAFISNYYSGSNGLEQQSGYSSLVSDFNLYDE